MYLKAIELLGFTLRSQLLNLRACDNVSAIFPVDLLYDELHSMTATLVTCTPRKQRNSTYEPNTVETPGLKNDEESYEVYWYAMGIGSGYWQNPILEEHEFGEVELLLDRSYEHLQMQWDNINFHAETLAEYAELSMMKFTFDSIGLVSGSASGVLGQMAGAMNAAVSPIVEESMKQYQQALGTMGEAEQLGLRILMRDIQDYTGAHQQEAGTVWSFMRDFSGHVEYLIFNQPIDPVLSVDVLSFEISDATITDERGMALTPGIITLANSGTLDWSGQAVINVYSSGRKILSLEFPNFELNVGEEGTISFGILLPDAQTYSLFGFDFELTLELWEEESLSRASYGPWVTTAQSGTEERVNRLAGSIPTHLLQQEFGSEEMHRATYTATQDGALRFMLLHDSAAIMNLHVFDAMGSHAGYDVATNAVVVEIPDAAFTGFDTRCQLVTIRNVQAGSVWTVDADGVVVDPSDQFTLLASELPDTAARLHTRHTQYGIITGQTNTFIQADIIEVGGTHGVTNLNITSSDFADTNGVPLDTDLIVFAFKGGVEQVDAGGRERLGLNIDLADTAVDGTYSMDLTVSGNDAITGVEVEHSFTFLIEVDFTAPAVPILQLMAESNNTGRVTLYGTAEPGASVDISNSNGVIIASVVAGTNGTYTTSELELIYGDYEMTAVAKDEANNYSEPSAPVYYEARTDWLDPVTGYAIEGTRTTSGAYLNTVSVSLVAVDDASGIDQTFISFDGGDTWTNYEATVSFNTPGSYSIEYYSVDLEGNQETSKTIYLSVTDQSGLDGFAAWAQQISNPDLRGEADCPMGDGIPNLAKYAIGLSPNEAHNTSDLFSYRLEGEYLILRYKKAKMRDDVYIIPKWTTSLTSPFWKRTGIEQLKIEAAETDEYEVWEARLPRTATSAFMRLSFSTEPPDQIVTFESWAQQITNPDLRGEADCPMGDGVPNLAKYAVGLSPNEEHSTSDLYSSRLEGEYLILRYKKVKLRDDVYIIPKWATSLISPLWSRVGIEQQKIEAAETDEYEVWEARLPRIETTAFMRLTFSTDPAYQTLTFVAWSESIPNPDLRGAADSPMGDGIPNLMKYAAGLDPMEACATADLFTSSIQRNDGKSALVILYYKDPSAVNVHLYPITAPSLFGEWTTDGVGNTFTGQTDEESRELWKAILPIQGGSGFLRLRAATEITE